MLNPSDTDDVIDALFAQAVQLAVSGGTAAPLRGRTILDAMDDPSMFGAAFAGEERTAWRSFLRALYALPASPEERALYALHTQRTEWPTEAAREAWMVIGRRGGKSQISAMIAVYLACARDYSPFLAPGEVGTLAVLASDRRQARTIMRYVSGFLDAPAFRGLVQHEGAESVRLRNHTAIEVHTASVRAVRGYTLIGLICDEIAHWDTEEEAANPDEEILNAARPGMRTIPGALLIAISSPYARQGALWRAYSEHYGVTGDPVLVWQAPSQVMNPSLDPVEIQREYDADEESASAEYGANFRRDIALFIDPETAAAAVVPGRRSLPRAEGCHYVAFTDPSGGSEDSMTVAVAHRAMDTGKVVIDALCEVRAPFSPEDAVTECAATVRAYGISEVVGDAYGGEWPRQAYEKRGVSYRVADVVKSDLYREALPLFNAGRVELLDQSPPRCLQQLLRLERRTGRGRRDTIDHPPRTHDDVINAACGALVYAERAGGPYTIPTDIGRHESYWNF